MNGSPAALTLLDAGHAAGPDLAYLGLLALAGVGSAVVLGLALAALVRRRSRSYLLVTLALATLLARTGVAALTLTGALGAGQHHLLEHGLDAAMAALVVAAVYDARRVRRSTDGGDSESEGGPTNAESLRSDGGPRPTARDEGGDEP